MPPRRDAVLAARRQKKPKHSSSRASAQRTLLHIQPRIRIEAMAIPAENRGASRRTLIATNAQTGSPNCEGNTRRLTWRPRYLRGIACRRFDRQSASPTAPPLIVMPARSTVQSKPRKSFAGRCQAWACMKSGSPQAVGDDRHFHRRLSGHGAMATPSAGKEPQAHGKGPLCCARVAAFRETAVVECRPADARPAGGLVFGTALCSFGSAALFLEALELNPTPRFYGSAVPRIAMICTAPNATMCSGPNTRLAEDQR